MAYSPLTMWTAVGYGNIVAGMNLYNVLNDPNAGPIAKGLAIAGQVAALCPILAPSVVKKLQALLQAFWGSARGRVSRF